MPIKCDGCHDLVSLHVRAGFVVLCIPCRDTVNGHLNWQDVPERDSLASSFFWTGSAIQSSGGISYALIMTPHHLDLPCGSTCKGAAEHVAMHGLSVDSREVSNAAAEHLASRGLPSAAPASDVVEYRGLSGGPPPTVLGELPIPTALAELLHTHRKPSDATVLMFSQPLVPEHRSDTVSTLENGGLCWLAAAAIRKLFWSI